MHQRWLKGENLSSKIPPRSKISISEWSGTAASLLASEWTWAWYSSDWAGQQITAQLAKRTVVNLPKKISSGKYYLFQGASERKADEFRWSQKCGLNFRRVLDLENVLGNISKINLTNGALSLVKPPIMFGPSLPRDSLSAKTAEIKRK